MSPILDAMSLLPIGIVFDMVVDMFGEEFTRCGRSFSGRTHLAVEILKPQEYAHVIGSIH
jgi:hypothetical protein